MLKVIRISNDEYVVMPWRERPVYGDRTKTVLVLNELGVDWSEIEEGIVSLQLNNHHVAHYGINRTFMFSAPLN